MMFACMKVETKMFYIPNANETTINYRKTRTLITKLEHTDILQLVNSKLTPYTVKQYYKYYMETFFLLLNTSVLKVILIIKTDTSSKGCFICQNIKNSSSQKPAFWII